jgi:hypothetical protein
VLLLLLLAKCQPKLVQQLLEQVWHRLITCPREGPENRSHITTAQPIAAATCWLCQMLQQTSLLLLPAAAGGAAAWLILHATSQKQLC